MTTEEDFEELVQEEWKSKHPRYASPRIFEGNWQGENLPDFDAVTIYLDGRLQSSLDWKNSQEKARMAIEQGLLIMWDIDLGLFGRLQHPLQHHMQFLSLGLSLEHFRESIWENFKTHTLGLSIYRGSADFSQSFSWNDSQLEHLQTWSQALFKTGKYQIDDTQLWDHPQGQQLVRLFCRDAALDYLILLTNSLPDELSVYLYLDLTSIAHAPLHQLQLLNPECFGRLKFALKGQRLPISAWGWSSPTAWGYSGYDKIILPPHSPVSIGLCVPPVNFYGMHDYEGLDEGLHLMEQNSLAFRIIAENQLNAHWDGLDYLLYSPAGLSYQGKRKLQGFCAAGGMLISTGALLDFPNEISLKKWDLIS